MYLASADAPLVGVALRNSVRMMSTEEVADFLGITPGTLNGMRVKGVGPSYVKLGGKIVRYRSDVVEAWLASCTRHSTSDQS